MSWNNIIKGLYLDIDMIFNIPQEIVAGHSLLYMYISIFAISYNYVFREN
jgi:hypothetical protein